MGKIQKKGSLILGTKKPAFISDAGFFVPSNVLTYLLAEIEGNNLDSFLYPAPELLYQSRSSVPPEDAQFENLR